MSRQPFTAPHSVQSKCEAHLLPLRTSIQRVVRWNVKHSNVLRAEALDRAPTRCVVRLAGDPERRHPMLFCQRDNHAASSLGVSTTTVSGLHHVPNVAGIADHVLIPTHPQADAPDVFAAGKLHCESVRGDTPRAALGRHSLGEHEPQVTIHREWKIKKFKTFRGWHSLDTTRARPEAVLIRHRHTARAAPAPSVTHNGHPGRRRRQSCGSLAARRRCRARADSAPSRVSCPHRCKLLPSFRASTGERTLRCGSIRC